MSENICLNSFTILSFDPNNSYVSFNAETLLVDNKIYGENTQNQNDKNNDSSINQLEYWIINENDIYKIHIKGFEEDSSFNFDQSNSIGPFFSIENALEQLQELNKEV